MWGTDHDQHADQDVLKVDVPVTNLSTPVEQLTMTAGSHAVTLVWDMVKISVPVTM
jgi:molybdenum cofactor biosynthesis enzyme